LPVIIFHREPYGKQKDAVKSYQRAIFIRTDPAEGGVLQGELLIDLWNKNKVSIDKNRDGIMQYIMLKGRSVDLHEIGRTQNSILTVSNAGIKTQEFSSRDEEQAKIITEALFLKYGDKIEVIIANNDAMAIGAIKVLQSHGYNLGDKQKTITVTGVDGIPEAIELINKGFMAGTVIQDAKGVAKALYLCGINLVEHKNPIEGTKYKFDNTGVSIRIPYRLYEPY
jgi:methyl-galactoside transport system substrate-binding protein